MNNCISRLWNHGGVGGNIWAHNWGKNGRLTHKIVSYVIILKYNKKINLTSRISFPRKLTSSPLKFYVYLQGLPNQNLGTTSLIFSSWQSATFIHTTESSDVMPSSFNYRTNNTCVCSLSKMEHPLTFTRRQCFVSSLTGTARPCSGIFFLFSRSE